MSYDLPRRLTYSFPAMDFSTTKLKKIRGPKGLRGKVVSVHAYCTTLFTAVTTAGSVDIGTDTTTNKATMCSMGMGTLAALATLESSNVTNAIKAVYAAADTDIFVNATAPTGGSPAGIADLHIEIEWF